MGLFRKFVDFNRRLSKYFDSHFVAAAYCVDGNRDYKDNLVRHYVSVGCTIYDVGGGKGPFFSLEEKENLKLNVIGIDISNAELSRAPEGAYDCIFASDIAEVEGGGDGDVVICQAVLEHVQDTEGAIRAISSLLKEGGLALIFVPCRNALFARLNMLLPQKIKELILYSIYPSTREAQGFPSYYLRCTPRDFAGMANNNGMDVEVEKFYFKSSYFEFLFPVYVLWRIYQWVAVRLVRYQAAETFSMVLVKRSA